MQRKISFFLEESKTRKVLTCNLKCALRLPSRMRGLCDVRASGAKMVKRDKLVVKCWEPLTMSRSRGGPNWWDW